MLVEACIFILFLIYLFIKFKKPSNMPPGSFGLPVFGNLLRTSRDVEAMRNNLRKMWETHGDIFSTKIGQFTMVYLASPALVKKAFSMPQLQERINLLSVRNLREGSKDYGVIMAGGETWKSNRRFLLQHLRNLGMGKSFLENAIMKETHMLADYIEENYLDKPSEVDRCVNLSILNVVWLMVASTRYEADDKVMKKFVEDMTETVIINQGPIMIINNLPWIANILPSIFYDKWTRESTMKKKFDNFYRLCRELIEEHKLNLDENDPRDIIDQYLVEKRDKSDKNYMNLMVTMWDMFIAGSDTTSGTLRWFILYMALYPEVQRKIHAEMDSVVGEQAPTMADRQRLPYLEASALDVMRLSSFAQLGLPHRATETVELGGYTIPKDTILHGCLFLIHRDPRYWENPNTLHPEHFLDAEGKLSQKNEAFMPFSLGKRACLGESLARMEVYLFTSALLHRFKIEQVPGDDLKDEPMNDQLMLNFPKPYKVIFRKRFQ